MIQVFLFFEYSWKMVWMRKKEERLEERVSYFLRPYKC
jgi:hypothetical protein